MHRTAQKMRAATFAAPNEIRIENIDIPVPANNGVRVRLEGCGVCGSNLPVWEGRPWFEYPLPAGKPGHEGWGVVDAIGNRVTRWKIGDRVALLSYNAFAEYDVASENCLVSLPHSIEKMPFPAEALGCAMNVFRRSEIKSGQTVAVVGIGFLGALLISLACRAKARVIAISRRPFALEIAREFGADEIIPMEDHQKIVGKVKSLTEEKGCDCVIEAVGRQYPLTLASELTRERGRLVIAGYHQDGSREINMQLWNWRGLDVINAHERDPNIYVQGMQEAANAIASREIDPSPLYTHTFSLHDIPQALERMKKRPDQFLKGLILL
jgi:threonine dehydrogenase-like Zn-dependent dehydrogenase